MRLRLVITFSEFTRWYFFLLSACNAWSPRTPGHDRYPRPSGTWPTVHTFLIFNHKIFFLCSNTTCTLNDRLICVIFNKDQHWLCDNVYNGCVCVLLQGPPGMDGPKGDIGNPGEQVLDFYGCFIKLNLSLNSRSTSFIDHHMNCNQNVRINNIETTFCWQFVILNSFTYRVQFDLSV